MNLRRKGQTDIAATIVGLLVIVTMGFVIITVMNNLGTQTEATISSTTSEAYYAYSNMSSGSWDSLQLLALAPYLLGALAIIGVITMFARTIGRI